jgi:hypothetical protein
MVGLRADVVIPMGAEPIVHGKESLLGSRDSWWLSVIARLLPGQSLDAATDAVRGVQPQIRAATLPEWPAQDLDRYLAAKFTFVPAATGDSLVRAPRRRSRARGSR